MSVKYGLSVRFTTYIPAMVTVLLLTGNAFGQLYPYYTFPWAAYDPAVSITSRVRAAQAELIRAQGDAAARFAEAAEMHASARLINADAYSAELDNWLKELRTRWNRRIANEEKKLEFNHVRQIAKLRYLNDQKWTNSRTWDRLKNHPEMAEGSAIKHGAALNFLLDRLSVAGALPYGEINPQAGPYGPDALTQLRIEPELLQHIVLEQDGTTFTAADFSNSSVTYWPFYLLWDDFESSRLEYEAARAVVVKECTEAGAATVDSIKNLQYALGLLTRDFMASVEVRRWAMENKGLTKWNKTRTFLAELDREVRRLEDTGDIRPFQTRAGWSPEGNGGNLVGLLSFMNSNGVRFASSKPSDEPVYHNLFVMMRSLYLTVAEDDESIQPVKLRDLVDHP